MEKEQVIWNIISQANDAFRNWVDDGGNDNDPGRYNLNDTINRIGSKYGLTVSDKSHIFWNESTRSELKDFNDILLVCLPFDDDESEDRCENGISTTVDFYHNGSKICNIEVVFTDFNGITSPKPRFELNFSIKGAMGNGPELLDRYLSVLDIA